MAMATPRLSLDPPNHHLRDPLPQPRRVSSESQTPGRASPAPRISRRTPVPFLLEAFPAPPSHIPGTPTSVSPTSVLNGSSFASATSWLPPASVASTVCTNPVPPPSTNTLSPKPVAVSLPHANPPPSSPPTGPLPPVPGPSSVPPDLIVARRALQISTRSASPALSMSDSMRSQSRAEQRPRLSLEGNEPVRGRGRQGSLSSLRNPIYSRGEQGHAIAEEPVAELPTQPLVTPSSPPSFSSVVERKSSDQPRGDSPDIIRRSLRRVPAVPLVRSNDKPLAEDSIAGVDMSDLNALKSDCEGDGDDQSSCPFPRFPPIPHSQTQCPSDLVSSAPCCGHTPRKPSKSSAHSRHVSSASEDANLSRRPTSPEITHILSATPRPRKRSTPSQSRDSSRGRRDSSKNRWGGGDVPPVPTSRPVKASLVRRGTLPSGDDEGRVAGEEGGNESDSSLDLHTPLPQLMLRHGMLSPNSKLLPQSEVDPTRLSILSSSSHLSNSSNISLMSVMSTSSKHLKDSRDTPRRRVRHRDGRLLKGGIGLTTGLGWSDSEDEDAPSPLTRRVSTLVLSRRASSSSVASYRSAPSSQSLARSISHSVLREADEYGEVVDEFGTPQRTSLGSRSLPSRSKPLGRVASTRSNGSSLGRYSTYSNSSLPATGLRARAGSASSVTSKPDCDTHAGLMPGIREHDDGMTPTRAAFERSSLGSLNSGSGADVPHTPSSTASSASLPFPATPESTEEIPQPQPTYNQDKVLPPLPPGIRGKYPSTLSLKSALQRPRTYSNASSVSNSSMLGVPPGDTKSRSASPTTTPRQSLTTERPAKSAIPTTSPRPSINGTPRPSLTIPKSPMPTGLPRPTTPSSPHPSSAQGYTPRPLRLAELNQTSSKPLQPGEQSPRPGQVLMYNRNVHDQLKLRTISLSSGPNHGQAPVASPGGVQTLFVPPPASPSSAVSTPVSGRSQSPLSSPGPGGEGFRPRPRTGTGMMYRTNLSVNTANPSRIRVPSTVAR